MRKKSRVGRGLIFRRGNKMISIQERLSIAELVKAAKETTITAEDVAALEERLAVAEKEFMEEARKRATTPEWYNRQYTI